MALRRVCRVLAATVALAAAVLALLTGPARHAAAAASPRLVVSVTSIGPAVVTPTAPLVVTGTVRNDGVVAVSSPVVRVVHGSQSLAVRTDVVAWARGRGPDPGQVLSSTKVGRLAPGATTGFSMTVKGLTSRAGPAYGALPLSVQTESTAVHTFASYQRKKEYEPLELSWIVPITLDADPALFGPAGADRDRAWAATTGPGSRLDSMITATSGLPVAWAVDPLLSQEPAVDGMDAGPSVTTTTSSDSSGSQVVPPVGGSTSPAEARLRAALSQRIRDQAPGHSPLVLPNGDADVASAAQTGGARGLVTDQIRYAVDVAGVLGGRADIAWPADGAHTAARERTLRSMYSGSLGAEIVSELALPPTGISNAARRSSHGLPLLAYDEALSARFAATTNPSSAALNAQQFVADSVLLLNELPGTRRNVLVAAPRTFHPDPEALRDFASAVGSVPWLRPVGLESLLDAAARATPVAASDALVRRPPQLSRDPVAAGQPVLTAPRGAAVEETLRNLRGVARVRADGVEFARVWTEAEEQLTSVRWRGHLRAWSVVHSRADGAARATARGVTVSPRSVNFLADKGRLQITVVNTLTVPVHDVTLRLVPDNPRLRVDQQPATLHIGARSRTTATARVTSLSAGRVPITTTLTGPDGTVLGRGTVLMVQLSPTGNWVYWVLGSIAGLILVLGIARSVRRRPRRAVALAAVPSPTPVEKAHR